MQAVVRVRVGGVALVAQQEAPGKAIVAELVPGTPARIVRLDGEQTRVLCAGPAVGPFDPGVGAILRLAITGGRAQLERDGASIVACDIDAPARGAWGVAAFGGEVVVDTVTVAR